MALTRHTCSVHIDFWIFEHKIAFELTRHKRIKRNRRRKKRLQQIVLFYIQDQFSNFFPLSSFYLVSVRLINPPWMSFLSLFHPSEIRHWHSLSTTAVRRFFHSYSIHRQRKELYETKQIIRKKKNIPVYFEFTHTRTRITSGYRDGVHTQWQKPEKLNEIRIAVNCLPTNWLTGYLKRDFSGNLFLIVIPHPTSSSRFAFAENLCKSHLNQTKLV